MPAFSAKQEQIERSRAEAIAAYPRLWENLISKWKENLGKDRAYLMYSANYLFRTGGIGWAIDPLTLGHRLPAAKPVDVTESLSRLDFVILTHEHHDHFDGALIHALRDAPIRWVVPQALLPLIARTAGLHEKNIIVPENLKPISMGDITVIPFEGMHWETEIREGVERVKGVPSTAYCVEFHGKRWLFPCDVRTYNKAALPDFGHIDGVFAHLWLGRKSALSNPPPLVKAFCEYFLSPRPRQIIVTHLEELGRSAMDYWDDSHWQLVKTGFERIAPDIKVTCAHTGDEVNL